MRIRNTKLLQTKQLQNIQSNQELNTTIITDSYTISNDDNIIICDNQANIDVYLPVINSETEKKLFIIRRINTGIVKIYAQQTNEFNINNFNTNSLILSDFNCGVILKAKGNIWFIIQKIDCKTLIALYENTGKYGYVCGGFNSFNYLSIIDRFQFPFDSGNAVNVGNLSISRGNLSANNSSIYGYICGGYNGSYFSIIDRFQFPLDNGNAIQVGSLSINRHALSANNSSIYGYVCGGYSLSMIDRFQFPFNSGNAIQVGSLSVSNGWLSANNSSTYGYVCGGWSSSKLSIINRFQFPFDSGNAIHVGNLSIDKWGLIANNSSVYGYVCGGNTSITYNVLYNLSIIDRFQFPFNSGNAIQVGNLNGNRCDLSANNSSIYGYVCGGHNYLSTIDRFQFPFNSGNAVYVGNLSGNIGHLSANDDTFILDVMY